MRFDLDTEIRYPDGRRAGFLRRVILDANGEVEKRGNGDCAHYLA